MFSCLADRVSQDLALKTQGAGNRDPDQAETIRLLKNRLDRLRYKARHGAGSPVCQSPLAQQFGEMVPIPDFPCNPSTHRDPGYALKRLGGNEPTPEIDPTHGQNGSGPLGGLGGARIMVAEVEIQGSSSIWGSVKKGLWNGFSTAVSKVWTPPVASLHPAVSSGAGNSEIEDSGLVQAENGTEHSTSHTAALLPEVMGVNSGDPCPIVCMDFESIPVTQSFSDADLLCLGPKLRPQVKSGKISPLEISCEERNPDVSDGEESSGYDSSVYDDGLGRVCQLCNAVHLTPCSLSSQGWRSYGNQNGYYQWHAGNGYGPGKGQGKGQGKGKGTWGAPTGPKPRLIRKREPNGDRVCDKKSDYCVEESAAGQSQVKVKKEKPDPESEGSDSDRDAKYVRVPVAVSVSMIAGRGASESSGLDLVPVDTDMLSSDGDEPPPLHTNPAKALRLVLKEPYLMPRNWQLKQGLLPRLQDRRWLLLWVVSMKKWIS